MAGIVLDGDVGRFEGVGAVGRAALAGTAAGATALGHRRARAAGLMLLAIGLAPIVAGLQTVYMAPAVASGALLVLGDHLARRAPTAEVGAPAPDRPREAAGAAPGARLSAEIVLRPDHVDALVRRW